MEQRNGRVDRHGQKAKEVDIFHFVGQGFDTARAASKVGDLEADLEFLMRAALKIETIREDLGKVGPVIAAQVQVDRHPGLFDFRVDEAAPAYGIFQQRQDELWQQVIRFADIGIVAENS